MANETTTTSANDLQFAAWVGDAVLDEIRPYMVSKPLMRFEGRRPSKAFDFPIMDDPGTGATNQTEGTAFTNTQLSTSKATATARLNGILILVTDVLELTSVIDVVSYFSQVLARTVAEESEVTIDAQYANYSNVTGTSGADLTIAQWLTAVSALEQRDALGRLVSVLHPVQFGDLRSSVQVTANAFYHGNSASGLDGIMDAKLNGGPFDVLGVETYMSSSVPTANAGADRAGGIFIAGVTNGLYEVQGIVTESHRDITQPGTAVVCTSIYGVAEIRDGWGQAIVTDA